MALCCAAHFKLLHAVTPFCGRSRLCVRFGLAGKRHSCIRAVTIISTEPDTYTTHLTLAFSVFAKDQAFSEAMQQMLKVNWEFVLKRISPRTPVPCDTPVALQLCVTFHLWLSLCAGFGACLAPARRACLNYCPIFGPQLSIELVQSR